MLLAPSHFLLAAIWSPPAAWPLAADFALQHSFRALPGCQAAVDDRGSWARHAKLP